MDSQLRTKSDMQMTSWKDTKFVGAHRLLLAASADKKQCRPSGVRIYGLLINCQSDKRTHSHSRPSATSSTYIVGEKCPLWKMKLFDQQRFLLARAHGVLFRIQLRKALSFSEHAGMNGSKKLMMTALYTLFHQFLQSNYLVSKCDIWYSGLNLISRACKRWNENRFCLIINNQMNFLLEFLAFFEVEKEIF
jgi:hypothetical protein